MSFEHDSAIGEYSHEKSRPREADALFALRKIASIVKPMMRTRGWRVGILAEFFPTEPNLLGLNYNEGQKICLRLRYPGDQQQFLPLDQVVDTMLHELSHIVCGPHDEKFHKLWNILRDEHEALLAKGYTGEGFLSTGHKLGGARMPRDEARRQARAQAEKRRTLNSGSGQRLGGAPVRRGQDIRNVIADAVARRNRVEKGCTSEQVTTSQRQREIIEGTNKNGTRTKAEPAHPDEDIMMTAFIDLVQEEEREKYGQGYVPPSRENPAGSQGRSRDSYPESSGHRTSRPLSRDTLGAKPPIPSSTKPSSYPSQPPRQPASNPKPEPTRHGSPSKPSYNTSWTCEICTCINPSTYLCCDACTTERPSPPPSPLPAYTLPTTNSHTSSLRDSNAKKAVKSLINLDKTTLKKEARPMGWLCHRCGNWMEEEWWTCVRCGEMKSSS